MSPGPQYPGECTSTRGSWGKRCPDCGRPIPAKPGPLKSWHSTRNIDPQTSAWATSLAADADAFGHPRWLTRHRK